MHENKIYIHEFMLRACMHVGMHTRLQTIHK